MKTISQIFEVKPEQWGLRGDPHLWDDLSESMKEISTELESYKFGLILDQQFNELIRQHGTKGSADTVFFSKYPKDGMSGGGVSLAWWRETGLPLLKNRFAALKESQP